MNRKSVLVIVLVLAVGLGFILALGVNRDDTIENNPIESSIATKPSEDSVQNGAEGDVDGTNVLSDATDATEENEKTTDDSKGTESNVNQPTKVTDSNEGTNFNKETEHPAMDDDGISDAFVKENVNLGVVEGERVGNDDVPDDNVSTDNKQPPKPTEDSKGNQSVSLTIPIMEITFETYNAMSAAEQQAVIDSFGSMEDFVVWFNYIKAQYELENPDIEIGADGVVDLS